MAWCLTNVRGVRVDGRDAVLASNTFLARVPDHPSEWSSRSRTANARWLSLRLLDYRVPTDFDGRRLLSDRAERGSARLADLADSPTRLVLLQPRSDLGLVLSEDEQRTVAEREEAACFWVLVSGQLNSEAARPERLSDQLRIE
jgi:hypothetical protein